MSRAEASLFLPPCGCVRAGALGSYGNEFCFQGTRPPSPWPPPRQGCSLAAARAHGGSVLVHCCSGRKVHPKPPDLTEAALLVRSELRSLGGSVHVQKPRNRGSERRSDLPRVS